MLNMVNYTELKASYDIDASVLLENNQWRIFYILTSEDIG